jgi:uncharacterized protein YndB with AHSA1/START domain
MGRLFIKKSIIIGTPLANVWKVLVNPNIVKEWADIFIEDGYVDSSFNVKKEVLWKNKVGKVISRGVVIENKPPKLLKIGFYDDVNTKTLVPGSYSEIYELSNHGGDTLLTITAGDIANAEYSRKALLWYKALLKIKALAEK